MSPVGNFGISILILTLNASHIYIFILVIFDQGSIQSSSNLNVAAISWINFGIETSPFLIPGWCLDLKSVINQRVL
jgi:hypothetical protein